MHLILSIFALAVFLLDSAQAQNSPFQNAWEPNRYELACDPRDQCLYGEPVHEKTETLMPGVVSSIRGMGFAPPTKWIQRAGHGTENDRIQLFETTDDTIASATSFCSEEGLARSKINIGSLFTQYDDRDHLLHYFMAHELFHVLMYENRAFEENCKVKRRIPGWIYEGTATAVGQKAARQRYPGLFPEKRDARVAGNFSGLRRYDKPLPDRKFVDGKENWTGDMDSYRTSSFWRHLAETYYDGRYLFLEEYMNRKDWHGNWVNWLKANVETGTGSYLGMVYGGFLADYSGWGDDGFPGQYFGRGTWLDESFGGCETLYLSKSEPADYVEVTLLPYSGECFEVNISSTGADTIGEGESFAVQIAAFVMSGSPKNREGLQLARVTTDGKQPFHCSKATRERGKQGIARCLFVPDDGKVRFGGGELDTRIWNVVAQEKGDPKQRRQKTGDRQAELQNLYTIGFAPFWADSEDTRYGGWKPAEVRVYFVLDVSKTAIDGKPMKGAVGVVGTPNADPQTTLPKKDRSGRPVGSYSKPDSLQPPFSPPAMVPPEMQGRLGHLSVGIPASGDSTAVTILPAKAGPEGKLEAYSLAVGDTGNFPALINAFVGDEMAISLEGSSIDVMEFNDLVLRARYQATLCRTRDLVPSRPGQPVENPCRNPFPVSGEIIKGFVGSRLPGNFMVVERTEGTEMYRKAAERGMSAWTESDPPPGNGDSGPGYPGSPGGSGGGKIGECQCTCEERAATRQRAEELKAREAAGESLAAAEFMGLMHCESPCRSQYFSCEMEAQQEQQEQRVAEAEARRKELKDGCDCSCDTLRGYESHLESLLNDMAAGKPGAQAELRKAGQCMEVCMDTMMQCSM